MLLHTDSNTTFKALAVEPLTLQPSIAENFLVPYRIQRLVKNPLFEAISLHGPTGPLKNLTVYIHSLLHSLKHIPYHAMEVLIQLS